VRVFICCLAFSLASVAFAQDHSCLIPPGHVIVVQGNVVNPGIYPVPDDSAPPFTVSTAITQAGGLTDNSGRNAFILRTDENGVEHTIAIQLRFILSHTKSDIELQAGDVLTIPDRTGRRIRWCFPSIDR
jgi:protein involved in polysaccharide export with SLBB domain